MATIKTSDDSKKMSYWDNLFKDTDYWDSYQSIINAYDEPTPQNFWGALTGKNLTNAYNHQMARNNAIDALAQKMRDEKYQSYENQVQQQRKAGLNPDLNGVQAGQVGQSAPNGVPDVSAESPLGVANVATKMFSSVLSAFNFATQYQQLQSGALDLDSKRLDNKMKLDLFASDYLFSNFIPESFINNKKDFEENKANIILGAKPFATYRMGLSRKQAVSFEDSVQRMLNNPATVKRFYDILSGSESSRRSYVMQTSGSFYKESDQLMRDLLGPLVNTTFELNKAKRYNELSDEMLYKAYKSSGRDIIKKLYKSYEDGSTMSGIALFLLNNLDIFKDIGVGLAKSYVESE